MIIYFADRQFNILGQASTKLPAGFRISQDLLTEDVDSGVNSFQCDITWTDGERAELTDAITAGNFILKSGSDDLNYTSLFQIVETELDTKAQSIGLYAEDGALDLLNTLCGPITLTGKNITQMMRQFLPSDWSLNIQNAPNTTQTYTWDGESTCTERLLSVVGLWDCELFYTFRIEGLEVKEKIVNVVKRRGLQEAIPQLRLNYDIDRIVTKTSIDELVTAINVKGGTPEGSETPINLINYTYSYTDPKTGDVYKVDKATGQMRNITAMDRWSSMIDKDGLWVGTYEFNTTNKAELAGQARAELQKRSVPAVNYEVNFGQLPEDVQIGDRVNIIDDEGELYLEARILKIETSEAAETKAATIGDYLIKSAGITQRVLEMAAQVKDVAESDARLKEQVQILAESVDSMLTLEVESQIISGKAHLKAHLFHGDKEVTKEHSEALYKWILRKDTGQTLLGRGYTLDVDLATMGYAGTILCRFIRPELYDLTDHNLIPITTETGETIQVSYAGVYAEPVVKRLAPFRALNKASNSTRLLTSTPEATGSPILTREVNLYEEGNLDKELKSTLQYFWTSQEGADAGAHITEVTREQFEADPENGGGNLLATSKGITVRDGLKDTATFRDGYTRIGEEDGYHVGIGSGGMGIYDDNVETAEFTSYGIRLGEYDKARVEINEQNGVVVYSTIEGLWSHLQGNRFDLHGDYWYEGSIGRIEMGKTEVYLLTGETLEGSSLSIEDETPLKNGGVKMVGMSVNGVIPEGGRTNKIAVVDLEVDRTRAGVESTCVYIAADTVTVKGSFVNNSDRRLKEHIKYLDEDGADFVRKLRPALFTMDGKRHYGFYAQEVRAVNDQGADLVSLDKDGYLGISYIDLIAPLVSYCQSLEKRIEELEAQNANTRT